MARKAESYEFAKYLEEAISEYGSTIGDDALVERRLIQAKLFSGSSLIQGKVTK
ncbi:MAG: hypothetical protein WC346_13160 [Methanogenium sp.]|jgi:hypothetical protein